tara:strand:- start:153 stop:428 length:276 start_codon:yes stop_codon:yes gene_type:complete
MHHGYEDELRNVMEREFEKKVGTSIPIKIERITSEQKAVQREYDAERGLYINYNPNDETHELTNDFDIIFDTDHEYGEYEERLNLFWTRRK